jgi:hypothetical protein
VTRGALAGSSAFLSATATQDGVYGSQAIFTLP